MTRSIAKMIFLSAALLNSFFALSEWIEKPSSTINFNSMIDEAQTERNSIAENLNQSLAEHSEKNKPPVEQKTSEDKTVTDFVDVELGWGEAPKMVDRRFNSEGGATVVVLN